MKKKYVLLTLERGDPGEMPAHLLGEPGGPTGPTRQAFSKRKRMYPGAGAKKALRAPAKKMA